jgi:hypothetical protein
MSAIKPPRLCPVSAIKPARLCRVSATKPRRATRAPWYLALVLAALAVGGCGAVKVQPGAGSSSSRLTSRGRVDSPLTNMHNHVACLKQGHLAVRELSPTSLQVGPAPGGPTVVFAATPGAAQADQIQAQAQGAEVIGAALLYPHQGSPSELSVLEACLDQGVQG